ncbi:MAG TPA: sugar phosphate isomerase/epimerase family protein [Candidatus Limnocylindria bacterium]|nr:sugar phosphate isomerase/epimerase family protein [Candidatus Limnocylindria bacterium]
MKERDRVRLAIQDRLLPGASLRERYDNARRYGFEAIELSQQPFEDGEVAVREHIPISAVCGGYRGWLIDPDPERMRSARADLARLVVLAGELGTGCVVVPIWGRTRNLPGIGTGRTREEDEALFVDGVRTLASQAERAGARIYIEPINRYQNDVCVTIADALRLRERVGSDAVFVMGDLFHMNIEEADMGEALASAGDRLGYVHLADSQRLEPGRGHLELVPVFAALARLRYAGYASFELAALSGDAASVLPPSVAFVRSKMVEARLA